jgi:hypothetical protein
VDSGVLSGDALGVVENLADHEAQHVTALKDLLESVGATPVEKPTFTFPRRRTVDLEPRHPGGGGEHRWRRGRARRCSELAARRSPVRQRGFPRGPDP